MASLRVIRTASRTRCFAQLPAVKSRRLFSSSPISSTSAPSPSPSISRIVDDISGLTLLQAADLITQLKTRLNIQEIAMPAASAAPAAAPAAEADAPVEEKPREKTIFTLTLKAFDAASKPKVIREVKALVPNMNLMDAKKFVESVPKVLKENVTKEDAEKLKAAFAALGAEITLD